MPATSFPKWKSLGSLIIRWQSSVLNILLFRLLVFGILNINKPVGKTSRDVVTRVVQVIRKATGTKIKAGHAGTLDPLASGVLVVCLGKATKLIQYIQRPTKNYTGTFRLDVTSQSADTETEVDSVANPVRPGLDDLLEIIPQFTGKIEQTPPAYSAISIGGKRAYELARKRVEFEIASKKVFIASITVQSYQYPTLVLNIECGSGTYIRSLGRDLARALRSDAVMTELVRTSVGQFALSRSIDFDDMDFDLIEKSLYPPIVALANLPKVELNSEQVGLLKNGRFINSSPFGFLPQDIPDEIAAVNEQGELVAILEPRDGQLKPLMNLS